MKTHGIVVSGVHSGMETVQSQDIKIKQTGLETKKTANSSFLNPNYTIDPWEKIQSL